MRTAYLATTAFALVLGAASLVSALEAPTSLNVADIRLLPPVPRPGPASTFRSATKEQDRALRLVREHHPEVLNQPSPTGRYMVAILLNAEGRLERSEVRQIDGTDIGAMLSMRTLISPDAASSRMITLQKGRHLPDGTVMNSDVMVQVSTLPPGFDATRAVTRVQSIVRERHTNLLLPASGEVLNRLTIFLTDDGRIEREAVEQTRFDALRRAPLEDDKFAERMAERFAKTLGVDIAKIGVVGFTYVEEGASRLERGQDGAPKEAGDRRTLLVQYAWSRKPGDTGPSMPMAAPAQQQSTTFDSAAALTLAEYHFRDAFAGPETSAGTPTILLNSRGEVLRTGRVQYRSGEIHETSLQQQLMPGIRLDRLISPTLKNSSGASAVVTFAWVTTPAG
jgi:hypothetical protein